MHLARIVNDAERRSESGRRQVWVRALALVDHVVGVAGLHQLACRGSPPAGVSVEKCVLRPDCGRGSPILRRCLRCLRRTVEKARPRRVPETKGFNIDRVGPGLALGLGHAAQELHASQRDTAAMRYHRRRRRRRADRKDWDAGIVVGVDRQSRKRAERKLRVSGPSRRLQIARGNRQLEGRKRQAVRLQQGRRQRDVSPSGRGAQRPRRAPKPHRMERLVGSGRRRETQSSPA